MTLKKNRFPFKETVCLIETESPTMSPQPASPSYDPEDVVCPRSPEKPVVLPPPASPGTPWCPNRDPFDDSRPAPRAVNPTPEFRPLEPFWNGPPSPNSTFSSDSFWEEVRKVRANQKRWKFKYCRFSAAKLKKMILNILESWYFFYKQSFLSLTH